MDHLTLFGLIAVTAMLVFYAGFIRRKPRIARSIELLVDPEHLPDLR